MHSVESDARVSSIRNRHDGTFGLNGNHAILTITIVVYACDLRERTSSEYSEDYRRESSIRLMMRERYGTCRILTASPTRRHVLYDVCE